MISNNVYEDLDRRRPLNRLPLRTRKANVNKYMQKIYKTSPVSATDRVRQKDEVLTLKLTNAAKIPMLRQ